MKKNIKLALFSVAALLLGACTEAGDSSSGNVDSISDGTQTTSGADSTTGVPISNSEVTSSGNITTYSLSDSGPTSISTITSVSTSISTGTSNSTSTSTGGSTSITDVPGKISVVLNYNNGGATATQTLLASSSTVTYGSIGLTNPTWTNYIFKGWFVDVGGVLGAQVTPDHPLKLSVNHILTARWAVKITDGTPTFDGTYNFEKDTGYTTGGIEYVYTEGTKALNLRFDAIIANGTRNRHNGSYSLRLDKRGYVQTDTKIDGLHQLSFAHAPYAPTDSSTVSSNFYIYYSVDEVVWTQLDIVATTNKDNKNGMLSYYRTDIGITYGVYVKIINSETAKANENKANLDDLRLMGVKFQGKNAQYYN